MTRERSSMRMAVSGVFERLPGAFVSLPPIAFPLEFLCPSEDLFALFLASLRLDGSRHSTPRSRIRRSPQCRTLGLSGRAAGPSVHARGQSRSPDPGLWAGEAQEGGAQRSRNGIEAKNAAVRAGDDTRLRWHRRRQEQRRCKNRARRNSPTDRGLRHRPRLHHRWPKSGTAQLECEADPYPSQSETVGTRP